MVGWSSRDYAIICGMRQPRNFATDRCYHLVSRIANRAFYLSEEERTRFVERMWRVAYFSCVDVLAYCVMDNHFHILAYVPPQRELSEEEVLARVRTLYLGDRLVAFEKDWALQLAHDDPVKAGLVKWPDEYRWCGFAAACAGDVRCIDGYRFIYTFAPVDWARARELHEMSIGLALKELDEDPEARAASGSNGGGRLSVTADRLENIRTLRRERMEIGLAKAAPDAMPRILERGSRRVAHDILAILAEGPRRPVEIRDMLGFSSANYFTAQYLTPMRKAGYIAQVGEANPHSPRLEYKITAKGCREIANG